MSSIKGPVINYGEGVYKIGKLRVHKLCSPTINDRFAKDVLLTFQMEQNQL